MDHGLSSSAPTEYYARAARRFRSIRRAQRGKPKDGSKLVLQMPWSAARCLFGGARLAGAGSIGLRARDIGGRLRLEVAGREKGVSVEVK
jgi:hypothetical protein